MMNNCAKVIKVKHYIYYVFFSLNSSKLNYINHSSQGKCILVVFSFMLKLI